MSRVLGFTTRTLASYPAWNLQRQPPTSTLFTPFPMSSLLRSNPMEESSASTQSRQSPPPRPVLASREMFFSILPRPLADHALPIRPLPALRSGHLHANTRLSDPATILNGLQRASLTALLAVLNDFFSDAETTSSLTRSIGDPTAIDDAALATLADKIDLGLMAFLAKRGHQNTADADVPPPSVLDATDSVSSTTAVPPPSTRTRVTKKSGRSSRSQKIRAACKSRDGEQCRFCKGAIGLSAHILPFSLQGRKTLDFWAFVAIFKGTQATAELKAAALDPDPTNPDNILNVVYLCHNCHVLLDKPMISLIPQILESFSIVFPYDPRVVEKYDVVVEFPAGLQGAAVAILQDDGEFKRMRPGHVLTLQTANPAELPLPHPLLLQLHAICSRMVVMRASAGYPVLMDDSSDGDTVFDELAVPDDPGDGMECYGELGGQDIARDPAVVVLELEQRRYEQVQLLQKLRAQQGAGPLGWCTLVV